MEDTEEKLNEWKEKRRCLEDVEVPRRTSIRKRHLMISILPTSVIDYVIKNPVMTSDKRKGRMSCWKHHRWSTWSSWNPRPKGQ